MQVETRQAALPIVLLKVTKLRHFTYAKLRAMFTVSKFLEPLLFAMHTDGSSNSHPILKRELKGYGQTARILSALLTGDF